MLIVNENVNRCQGLYRGRVLQHLPHGKLKVFVYGVYPEEYMSKPEMLPVCEQIVPLWAGTNNGNGCFSYPNIDSTVWIQFANEDVNYPVVIGATLGGQNAYNQYNQIKTNDEDVSNKHMFTTGMAHFQMHESGKISSYVQQPYDNNANVNFNDNVIDTEVATQIDNNEISHIVCQQVIDNDSNFGEISVSTHKYVPYSDLSTTVSSFPDTQTVMLSTVDKEISSVNQNIRNNLGIIDDSQICSIAYSNNFITADFNVQTAFISTYNDENIYFNNENNSIDNIRSINNGHTYSVDTISSSADYNNQKVTFEMSSNISAFNDKTDNYKSENKTQIYNTNEQSHDFISYDNKLKELCVTIDGSQKDNISENILDVNGSATNGNIIDTNNTSRYIYGNMTTQVVVLSNDEIKTNKSTSQQQDNAHDIINDTHLSTYNHSSQYISIKASMPEEYKLSTLDHNKSAELINTKSNEEQRCELHDIDSKLSIDIYLYNAMPTPMLDVTYYNQDLMKDAYNIINYDKYDHNINNQINYLTNILSIHAAGPLVGYTIDTTTHKETLDNQFIIDENNCIDLHTISSYYNDLYIEKAMGLSLKELEKHHTEKFDIASYFKIDNLKNEIYNEYKAHITDIDRKNQLIKYDYLSTYTGAHVLDTFAGKQSLYLTKNHTNKQSDFEIETETIDLCASIDIECNDSPNINLMTGGSTASSTCIQKLDSSNNRIINRVTTGGSTADITLDLGSNNQIIIGINSVNNYACSITLNAADGTLTINSDKNIQLNSGIGIKIKSDDIKLEASNLVLNSDIVDIKAKRGFKLTTPRADLLWNKGECKDIIVAGNSVNDHITNKTLMHK